MTANLRSSSTEATSIARVRPEMPMRRHASSSLIGRSRLRASRLPVPVGRMASGTSHAAIAVTAAMTVPSPPATNTRSQPCLTASRHMPAPGSSTVVSSQSGSSQPCRDMNVSTRRVRAGRSVTLVGL